jgi:hypothetical protein
MANANLLDIAKLNGSDPVVGLIEENLTFAPELSVFLARQIRGTSYKTTIRTSYPSVGFRQANEGVAGGKSEYINKLVECYILSANITVDKAVARAYEEGEDAFKALEASGVMKQALIELGSQIFYGVSVDAKGFPGLQSLVDSALTVDAGGTTANTGSSVYGVKMGVQDCHLVFGNNSSIQMADWSSQTISNIASFVSDLTAWVGLQAVNKNAILRLKDATEDSTKGVTDAKLAELLSKAPVGMRPDYWFMNRRSAFQLQSSRSSSVNATGVKSSTGAEVFAPFPSESNGIPIVVTDSLGNTEALS